MAFSLGALTAYVDEHRFDIITKTLYGSKTAQLFTPQDGIKYKAKINIMATTAQFQAGSCTFNASGATTLTQRELAVVNIQVMETLCMKDLVPYFTNKLLKPGFNASDFPMEHQYVDLKADLIARQLEIAYWQGDTASPNANLKQFDGWLKIIDAAGTAVNGNTGNVTAVTGITASNVVAIVNAFFAAIPAHLLRQADMGIYMGTDTFRLYAAALVTANLYSYNGQTDKSFEISLPGFAGIKIYGLDGLTGTNRIIAARASNMYIGTDMLHEEEKFMFKEDQYGLNLNFLADFKVGVQVAFPDEITSFKLA